MQRHNWMSGLSFSIQLSIANKNAQWGVRSHPLKSVKTVLDFNQRRGFCICRRDKENKRELRALYLKHDDQQANSRSDRRTDTDKVAQPARIERVYCEGRSVIYRNDRTADLERDALPSGTNFKLGIDGFKGFQKGLNRSSQPQQQRIKTWKW